MTGEIMIRAKNTARFLIGLRTAYLLLAFTLLTGITSVACDGGKSYSPGESTTDGTHAFKVISAIIVENAGKYIPEEDYYYLVMEVEIENVGSGQDTLRDWSQQVTVEDSGGKECKLTFLEGAGDQIGNTTLQPGQKESGIIYFTTKQETRDFELTFVFPTSGHNAVYDIEAEDQRLGLYVDRTLEMLEQMESVRKIPVIGKLVERINRSALMYFGETLVPKDEVKGLLEQIKDLSEEERRELIENYIRELKGWASAGLYDISI